MTATSPPQLTSAEQYYARLAEAKVAPLWLREQDPEPRADEVPYVWRWKELYPLLAEASQTLDLGEGSERRALTASNPGGRIPATTNSMVAAYQMVLPGERAGAHRHSPGAIRLMLAGRGHTVVDGEPILMARGDLILTPGMTWHDHRNDGEEPMVWLDGLDAPFVRQMRAAFFENHPGSRFQEADKVEGDSVRRYGSGLVPTAGRRALPHSPLMRYRFETSHAALRELQGLVNDEHDGVKLEYTNPVSGGHVLPTMACYLQLLTASSRTRPQRHTSSTILCPLSGRGYSMIGGERFDWEENDFFVIPSWSWYEHVTEEEVVLFSMSDRAILEPFNLYREERA
jgi:gentisate 1,2-dioxygenase